MPGKRSPHALQKRYAQHLILETSRYDRYRAESICALCKEDVLDALQQKFGYALPSVAEYVKGEVLVDARGQGSLQQLPKNFISQTVIPPKTKEPTHKRITFNI